MRELEEREKKLLAFFVEKRSWLFFIFLLIILIFVFQTRTSNVEALKDITTNNYTLGPDLDPFLFLRWAKYIAEHGKLMENDEMRYAPIGLPTKIEHTFLAYSIAYTYKILHFFSPTVTIEYAAIIFPVFFFLVACIAFFLFVRRVFIKSKNADLIAIISTAFFAFMPSLLHRTTAGIPEKEAPGIAFMFLAFYFFVLALQAKGKMPIAYGLLAGIFTGLLGLVWGGVTFVLISIPLATLIFFFLRNFSFENFLAYSSWAFVLTLLLSTLTARYGGIKGLVSSTTSGIIYFVFLVLFIDFFLVKYKGKIKIPRAILSFLIVFIFAIIFLSLTSNPIKIVNKIKLGLLHPIGTDRITLTVAENNQPFFSAWHNTFGIWFFWLFVAASVLLFYEVIVVLKRHEKYLLSLVYFLFLLALIFSRLKPESIMNGTSSLANFVYFFGFFLFIAVFAFIYFRAYKTGEAEKFKLASKEYVLLLVMFVLASISARGAIRLFFLLAPIVSALAGFIAVNIFEKARNSKSEMGKIFLWLATILVAAIIIFSFINFAKATTHEARGTRPGAYQYQWQLAMSWVRENTPKNAVFAHWWDYGYWIQTIGERATVLDGGNAIGYWNHLMGRHVLTGKSEQEALEFLLTHNASYLLIDSTEIGKYPAYSSIGSDLEYDRYNFIATFFQDERATYETRNETIYLYRGGVLFDKDFVWYDATTKKQYIFPANSNTAIIAGFLLKQEKEKYKAEAIVVYRNERINVPLCHLYIQKKYSFEEPCLNMMPYIIPLLRQTEQGISVNNIGAALWLNSKALDALWVRLYLLNEGENFLLAHKQENLIIQQLRQQINLPEIVHFGDIQGPIKIWKINYPENIKIRPEYLEKNYPDIRLTIPR